MVEVLATRDAVFRAQQKRLKTLLRQLGEQTPEDKRTAFVQVLDYRIAISQASKLLKRKLRAEGRGAGL